MPTDLDINPPLSSRPPKVAVIGAGAAGIAAAMAVGSDGTSVTVVERLSDIGGTASHAMVGTICGLARCEPEATAPPTWDLPGFPSQFAQALASASNTALQRNQTGLTYLPYSRDTFPKVAHSYLAQLPNCQLLTEHTLVECARCADGSFLITLSHAPSQRAGHHTLQVDAVIDCSGDAEVSRALDLPAHAPHPPQAGALVFALEGLPSDSEPEVSFLIRKTLREAAIDGALPEHLTGISIVPGSLHHNTALFKLGLHPDRIPASPDADGGFVRSTLQPWLDEIMTCLKQHSSALAAATPSWMAPHIGRRSGPRGIGRETLTDEMVLASRRHPEGVALGLWPCESWNTPVRPELLFPSSSDGYEIPLGCLIARDTPGLFFAGRCISATDRAIASARVIGTSLATGYAAGRAAHGYLYGTPLATVVAELRSTQIAPFYQDSEVVVSLAE